MIPVVPAVPSFPLAVVDLPKRLLGPLAQRCTALLLLTLHLSGELVLVPFLFDLVDILRRVIHDLGGRVIRVGDRDHATGVPVNPRSDSIVCPHRLGNLVGHRDIPVLPLLVDAGLFRDSIGIRILSPLTESHLPDSGDMNLPVPNPDFIGNCAGGSGFVLGLKPGLAGPSGKAVLECLRQLPHSVANTGKGVFLQPCILQIVAQLRKLAGEIRIPCGRSRGAVRLRLRIFFLVPGKEEIPYESAGPAHPMELAFLLLIGKHTVGDAAICLACLCHGDDGISL